MKKKLDTEIIHTLECNPSTSDVHRGSCHIVLDCLDFNEMIAVEELLSLRQQIQRMYSNLNVFENRLRQLLKEAIADNSLGREQRMIYVEWLHELKAEDGTERVPD